MCLYLPTFFFFPVFPVYCLPNPFYLSVLLSSLSLLYIKTTPKICRYRKTKKISHAKNKIACASLVLCVGFSLSKVANILIRNQGKGKGRPRIGHKGPEGEQMYSSILPSPSALDGSGWSTPRPSRFTPWQDPVHIL